MHSYNSATGLRFVCRRQPHALRCRVTKVRRSLQLRLNRNAEGTSRLQTRKKFIDGPVLLISLSPDVRYSYDPNNVIGIDTNSTVYPTLRLVDAWGVLTVSNGAWIERDATGRIISARVPAPTDLAARPLKGDGWSLELTNGWEVVPGERSGNVKIRKRP